MLQHGEIEGEWVGMGRVDGHILGARGWEEGLGLFGEGENLERF